MTRAAPSGRGRAAGPLAIGILAAVAVFVQSAVEAHPWHRHDADERAAERETAAHADSPASVPFRLVSTRKPAATEVDVAAAFAPFETRGDVATRRDDRWFYVESNGIPDHPLMVGIRAWQQHVPLPQNYVGDNAWRIPLHPVPAANPQTTKDRFLRGAIALAVNGIPITPVRHGPCCRLILGSGAVVSLWPFPPGRSRGRPRKAR